MHFNYKKLPRRTKKKYKYLLDKYKFLSLNQKMWYILGEINPSYKEQLILKIIEKYK